MDLKVIYNYIMKIGQKRCRHRVLIFDLGWCKCNQCGSYLYPERTLREKTFLDRDSVSTPILIDRYSFSAQVDDCWLEENSKKSHLEMLEDKKSVGFKSKK